MNQRTVLESFLPLKSSLEAILNEDWLALKPSEVKSYAPEKFEVYEQAVENFKCTLRNPVDVILGRSTSHFGPILQGSLPPTLTQIRTLARDQHKNSKESSKQADDLMKNKRKEYNFSSNKSKLFFEDFLHIFIPRFYTKSDPTFREQKAQRKLEFEIGANQRDVQASSRRNFGCTSKGIRRSAFNLQSAK